MGDQLEERGRRIVYRQILPPTFGFSAGHDAMYGARRVYVLNETR